MGTQIPKEHVVQTILNLDFGYVQIVAPCTTTKDVQPVNLKELRTAALLRATAVLVASLFPPLAIIF